MRTPHTSAPRGKRVRVVLRTGEEFVDKFLKNVNNTLTFQERGDIKASMIKSFSIYRKPPYVES
jgi:hypothetical protein